MPLATVNDIRLFYRLEGKAGAPVLVMSHSLGTDHAMWSPQMEGLLPHFQILRYDTRGHGASGIPVADCTVEELGRDVLGLADHLGLRRFAFCGLSMGGAIGQWLALQVPDRLTHLVLANTSPQFGPRSHWEARRNAVREGGMAAIVDAVMQRFFSAQTLARDPGIVDSARAVFLGVDPIGYCACCAALRDVDHRAVLKNIHVPTLVIGGDGDVSTPWDGHGDALAREIPGAQAVRLPAAHLSNLERPQSFTAGLLAFLLLEQIEDPFEEGLAVRRRMLGNEHVDRAMAASDDFTRDFQELITRYAWGSVWTRPGLTLHARRLLTLAIAASLGRWEEFRLHVRTGLAHELEPCDLREVLLQTAIYAGVPAANTAFHIAQEELERTKTP